MTRLVQTYQQPLYRYLRQMLRNSEDAKDVLQNTWIQVYTHLGELRQQSSERAYLYRIATNCAYMWLRDQQTLPSVEDVDPSVLSEIPADTHISLGEELVMRLEQTILRLPPAQRAVFCLRYHEEMTYEEIAVITDSTVGAAKTNYSLAKAKISRWITSAAASLLLLISVGLGLHFAPSTSTIEQSSLVAKHSSSTIEQSSLASKHSSSTIEQSSLASKDSFSTINFSIEDSNYAESFANDLLDPVYCSVLWQDFADDDLLLDIL